MTYKSNPSGIQEKKALLMAIRTNSALEARDDALWLADELEKAWAALEFYAEEKNWFGQTDADGVLHSPQMEWELGKQARKALNDD